MSLPSKSPALRSDLILHVFGSATANPGPGGWAAVWRGTDGIGRCLGRSDHATSLGMIMTAIAEGLGRSPAAESVCVCTDSKSIVAAIMTGMAEVWRENDWRKVSGDGEVKNALQWADLLNAIDTKGAAIYWRHGHLIASDREEAKRMAKGESLATLYEAVTRPA